MGSEIKPHLARLHRRPPGLLTLAGEGVAPLVDLVASRVDRSGFPAMVTAVRADRFSDIFKVTIDPCVSFSALGQPIIDVKALS